MTLAERDRLLALLDAFARRTVLVVGDFVADEFVAGEISRVSREAPVLILRHRETRLAPGGGANAANNLAELGARVLPVAVVGDDGPGRALVSYFRQKGVDARGIERLRGWATPTKTRYLAGWSHTARQQVLRVDREPGALGQAAQAGIERRARALAARADAVLLSDYGFGAVTPLLARRLVRANRRRPVTLDSRYSLLAFAGLGITAATPNEPELEAQYHTSIGSDRARLGRLGERTRRKMGLQALVVTRGKDGMVVFEPGRSPRSIPIYGSDEVADVTGAGDTVVAVFTLALAAGGGFCDAALLANYAGGIVVMKQGTATVSRGELEAAVRSESSGR
ncbi:MAG TPA: PfkB family carbohydrate kinase [Candidatus Acidoferrales bacterium]|nr:PfkB family carbohydrate kinase [Candidatus Acidoferrales bacterium]